ncbi:ABC transporter ATP-binding protein [Cryptosporangium phraense]|uniref:ABC transporter ATP-binding protein n=1 Tax=Cryptosporangium phraense TaxID=2593070 RepID=UPI001F10B773|nr:ABC transporter ATP-binding protein [Cryptosporangium phraense]
MDVVIDDLSVHLGGARILDGVSLTVPAGCFATLLGPSGSGKTTTLNVLAGFTEPSAGDVRLGDRSLIGVPPNRRDIGVVFQNYALFPHLSVGRNVEFPLIARKLDQASRRAKVAAVLELVHLPDVADRSVRSLSGGQQQRIALARALVFEPNLLLLDEPLAALDKQLREAMQLELKRIQRETGTTTVAVTHDQVEALSMSDLVAILHEGRIVQVGSPEEVYRRPATRFVAQFLGEANLLPVVDGRAALFGLPSGGAGSTTVLRPEDLELTAADHPGTVAARVTEVVYQGARLRLTVLAEETSLVVSAVPGALPDAPVVGDAVGVRHRGGELRSLHDA